MSTPSASKRQADGTGQVERLTTGDHRPMFWSRDGRQLVFADIGGRSIDIGIVSLDGDRRPRPLITSDARETMAELSPDGRWIVYFTNETGTSELFVRPPSAPAVEMRHRSLSTSRTSHVRVVLGATIRLACKSRSLMVKPTAST